MKKISLFLGVLLVLLIALPFLLKDQLITKEFAKVHENEGVFVSYQNSSLNLFSFPSIAISLTDVVVKNEKFSQQAQLAKCEKLSVQISLSELFSEDPVIKSVILQKGTADLFIDEKGKRNFYFSSKKRLDNKKQTLIEQISLNDIDVNLIDQSQKINAQAFVKTIDWNESSNIEMSLNVLLKQVVFDGKTYFTNRALTVNGSCERVQKEIIPRLLEIGIDSLNFSVEPKGTQGWHVFSDIAKIEHFLAVLPDFACPNVEELSSNKPLAFDAVVQRRELKKLLVEAQGIELKNFKSGKEIEDINFQYLYKKRDSKLDNLNIRGLGSVLTGHCVTRNLKENEIELLVNGKLDVKNIIDFLYAGKLQGTGELVFESEISKENQKLQAEAEIKQVTISDSQGNMIYQLDGGLHLANDELKINELLFNPQKENLSLSGTIHEPINFLLLNQLPVTGELYMGCRSVMLAQQNFDDVRAQFEFGFVPSKEFLYIVGLPVNPFVSPTYLNLNSVDFVQRDFNEQHVHLSMSYETKNQMHLKELKYQVGDTLFQLELVSDRPENLTLFAFKKQQCWAKCRYENFSFSNLLKRVGLSIDESAVLTGEFESKIGYQPTKLLSGKNMTVDFTDLVVNLFINDRQIIANGNLEYKNKKINREELTITEGKVELLEEFLLSFF